MSSATSKEDLHSEQLRKDYKGAFDEWALQISRLQAVSGSDPGGDVQEARERARAAEIAYRDSRDRLTDNMGWTPLSPNEPSIK